MNHTHFKTHVDSALRQKIYDIVNEASFYHLLNGAHFEAVGDGDQIDAIEGNWVSGWIPKQDGGYRKTDLIVNGVDNHLTEKQREYNAEKYTQMHSEFMRDFGISCESDIDYDDAELMETLREYEDATFSYAFLEFRAYVRAQDVILEIVLDYGPELEVVKKCSISIPDFLKMSNDDVLNMVANIEYK